MCGENREQRTMVGQAEKLARMAKRKDADRGWGRGCQYGVGGERWRVVGADIILRLGDLGDVPVVTAAAEASDGLITAEHLRYARAALDRLTGRAGVEDMLDALFGAFCVGKW